MTAPFVPDVPSPSRSAAPFRPVQAPPRENAFGAVLNDLGTVLSGANNAEENFASGAGDLQQAIYERARADVALAVATAAAQRSAQALQAIFTMQV